MKKDKRDKKHSLKAGGKNSIISQVHSFLQATYPASWMPKIIAKELGFETESEYETVKKSCQRLLKSNDCQRPTGMKRNWYMGIPTADNISALESPPVEIHNLSFVAEISMKIIEGLNKGTKDRGSAIPLYTNRDIIEKIGSPIEYNKHSDKVWYQYKTYWVADGNHYDISFHCHEEVVEVHLHASKHPLSEMQFASFYSWLHGMLQGLGINVPLIELKITKAELNKDYTKITITPKMLEIRELLDGSWLRIYRKYRNLHRLEIGTTWEGDKQLYELFEQFGKEKVKEGKPMLDEGGMFR